LYIPDSRRSGVDEIPSGHGPWREAAHTMASILKSDASKNREKQDTSNESLGQAF